MGVLEAVSITITSVAATASQLSERKNRLGSEKLRNKMKGRSVTQKVPATIGLGNAPSHRNLPSLNWVVSATPPKTENRFLPVSYSTQKKQRIGIARSEIPKIAVLASVQFVIRIRIRR
jgi:hypothetical protein